MGPAAAQCVLTLAEIDDPVTGEVLPDGATVRICKAGTLARSEAKSNLVRDPRPKEVPDC